MGGRGRFAMKGLKATPRNIRFNKLKCSILNVRHILAFIPFIINFFSLQWKQKIWQPWQRKLSNVFSTTRGLKLSIQIAFFSMSIVSRGHFDKIEQVERRKKLRKKSSIKYIYASKFSSKPFTWKPCIHWCSSLFNSLTSKIETNEERTQGNYFSGR